MTHDTDQGARGTTSVSDEYEIQLTSLVVYERTCASCTRRCTSARSTGLSANCLQEKRFAITSATLSPLRNEDDENRRARALLRGKRRGKFRNIRFLNRMSAPQRLDPDGPADVDNEDLLALAERIRENVKIKSRCVVVRTRGRVGACQHPPVRLPIEDRVSTTSRCYRIDVLLVCGIWNFPIASAVCAHFTEVEMTGAAVRRRLSARCTAQTLTAPFRPRPSGLDHFV